MIYSFVFTLALVQQSINLGGDFDRSLDWKTIETKHFYLHYPPSLKQPAYRLSEMVEPIRDRLTQKFRWSQADKVHVVLSDFSDESNGLSTPLPYNLIYLYAAPPTDDSALDYYDEWLKLLFTHEFTHSVHIDMALGVNGFLRSLFGRFIVPNAAQQQWGLEGLAELQETLETTRGRGRSPFVEMFLRTASLEDRFLSIDRATYWHDAYPYGNAAYFYGVGFYQYLCRIYGEEKIYDFTEETASWPIPAFFNFKTKAVFGKSFDRLWNEWRVEEKQKWDDFRIQHPNSKLGAGLLKPGERIDGIPTWDEDGRTLYAGVLGKLSPEIRAIHFLDSGETRSEKIATGAPRRLFKHKNFLIFSKMGFAGIAKRYSDIYVLNLENKESKRLTYGLRLRDPIVVGDQIIAVRTDALRSSLVSLPLPTSWDKDEFKESDQITNLDTIKTLVPARGFDTINRPSASPNGRWIVFSMREEMKARHLYLFDRKDSHLMQITDGPYEEFAPTFSRNGDEILFSSPRPLSSGPSKYKEVLISNIFSLSLSTKKIGQVTQVVTGTDFPAAGKSLIAFGHFRSDGFDLQVIDRKLERAAGTKIATFPTKKLEASQTLSLAKGAQEEGYNPHSALLPHYVFPFFFYTESDFAIGATTTTFDPLQTHNWGATAWYISTPQRPGGALFYSYRGIDRLTLNVNLAAGISDYGNVLFKTGVTGGIQSISEHYYERNYIGDFGATYGIFARNGFSGFSIGSSVFAERREALLALPAGALEGRRDLVNSSGQIVATDVASGPEHGNQLGVTGFATYENSPVQRLHAESPSFGTKVRASAEYSPSSFGSNFKQLLTMLSAKTFFEITDGHYLAANSVIGLQWFQPLYQRSFQLGGSFGESPFQNVNKRIHPLRGMPSGQFKGEGLVSGSGEYRFGLFRKLPGFGTAPIWFKNLFAAAFVDYGQTFEWKQDLTMVEYFTRQMNRFGWNRFSMSAGAELRSNVSIGYAPPLTFRLGYGHLVFLEGENVIQRNLHEVYFAAGSSF